MRTVPGLERASVQWVLIVLCVVLMGLAAAGALSVRRAAAQIRELHAAGINARAERDQLEARLVREQSTREALSLELARQQLPGKAEAATIPTLTLHPDVRRSGEAPQTTVSAPLAHQTIQLRLVFPKGTAVSSASLLEIALRGWSSGKMIWSRGDLRVTTVEKQPAVVAYVTGDVLAPGAYEVIVRSDAGEIAAYEVAIR